MWIPCSLVGGWAGEVDGELPDPQQFPTRFLVSNEVTVPDGGKMDQTPVPLRLPARGREIRMSWWIFRGVDQPARSDSLSDMIRLLSGRRSGKSTSIRRC